MITWQIPFFEAQNDTKALNTLQKHQPSLEFFKTRFYVKRIKEILNKNMPRNKF